MAALGLWDLVAPYFLLGVSPSEVQAALAALEVDERDPWIDLADTTVDFERAAPREGSQSIAQAQGATRR